MTVRLPIDLRRRPAKPQRTFVLADLSAVGEDLPEARAEDLTDALRANTIRRVLVRHDRRHHTARVYIDKPPGDQRPAAG
jgi:hypothetical protein